MSRSPLASLPVSRNPGFTLIELLVTLAIISILAAVAFPLSEMSVRRGKEKDLREALWQIRTAIDAYRRAVDDGRILRSPDQSGYPPTLVTLVEGVTDARDPASRKIYFLRRIPRDPMSENTHVPPAQSWGKRSYESPPDAPREGKDVFDVYSISKSIGLNGVPYREW
jgi:general secretion pathway protein G